MPDVTPAVAADTPGADASGAHSETQVVEGAGAETASRETGGGRGRRPPQSRSRKPQRKGSGRRLADDLVDLVRAALDRPATIIEDGTRRRGSQRELIVSQLVDRSAQADLRATKLLVQLMQKAAANAPPIDELDDADEKVITTFLARLGMAE